jgi:hypothetical protein
MVRLVGLHKIVAGMTAVFAIALGMIAIGAGDSGASTRPVPDRAVTCTLGTTLTFNFAQPGISKAGQVGTRPSALWSISNYTLGGSGCSGSGGTSVTLLKAVKCDKRTPGLPSSNPACQPGEHGFNSWANFSSGGQIALAQSDSQDATRVTINGIAYSSGRRPISTSAIPPGGLCGSSEEGYQTVTQVKQPKQDKSQTITITACLGAVTGTGLTSSTFIGVATDQNGMLNTAEVDPATSTVHVG